MVSVRSTTPSSAGRAGSVARQASQESEDGGYTPLSTPGPSSHHHAVPRAEFNFRLHPDTALPSIEGSFSSEETWDILTPSTPPSRAPSNLATPPGSSPRYTPRPRTTGRDDSISNINSRLQGMRFSTAETPMGMAGVSRALQDVEAGRDSRSAPLLSPLPSLSLSPSPLPSPNNRRRSGSRPRSEKHNVRNEVPPNDTFNNPAFQKALQDTMETMTRLVSVLASSSVGHEPDSVMARLYTQARDLSKFECPSRRTVGVVGDSGAGKSSLLNSLLDFQGLARSSNGGGACTCVVTEFHYHEDESFTIRVETFSEEELMPQLEGLLQDYRHFHLNRESFDAQELNDLERRAEIARDTFRAMFPEAFVDQITFIRDTEPGSLSTLRSWVRSFDRTKVRDMQSGLGLDECSSLLMQLSSDVQSGEAPLWPWISKIRLYSNAHILSKGLILVDLPGLRDLDTARRNITERYLLKCNEIFVVASEGRATTDEGVQSVIELAKKAKLSNVGIICTKSDEINPEEALKDWKGKRAAKEIQEKLEIIKKEQSELDDLNSKMTSPDESDSDDPDDADARERRELRLFRAIQSSREKLRAGKLDLQHFIITTRNKTVEKKLIDLYQHDIPGNRLQVFCASNKIYWDFRDKPSDKSMPSLKLSGVLAIRQHCMSIVSESQRAAATKWMKDDIGVLLGELDLWVRSAQGSLSAERKQKIRSTLDALERKLYLELCGRASRLNVASFYKREFDTKLYRSQGDNIARWSAAAKRASDDWTSWHHASYSAFCRNYGTHSTATKGYRNWNEEIICEMVDSLNPPWEQLQISLDLQSRDIEEFLDELFEEADDFLTTKLNDSMETVVPISSTLEAHIRVLKTDIENILDDLQVNLRTLRTDALSSIRTSFIGKAMEDAYDNARRQYDRGSDARRKAIINAAVRRPGLFTDLLKSFKRDFDDYVNESQDRVRGARDSHFGSIRDTFNIVRSDNIALESENDPDFRRRVEAALVATNEDIHGIYTTIETSLRA